MTVKELMELRLFAVENQGEELDADITKPFCCDLLSIAMSKAPRGCAWVTVMGNMNTLAVASLTEAACVILAESAILDEQSLNKARKEGVTILKTDMPIFDAAMAIAEHL